MTDLADILTGDYQHHYNGLTFGAGTSMEIVADSGLRGYTARVTDRERDRGHGASRGPSWTVARDIELTLEVIGAAADCEAALADIAAAFGPQVTGVLPLVSRLAGEIDTVHYCYPTGLPWELAAGRERVRQARVALRAPDPRIYSAEALEVVVPLYTGGGGSGFNSPIVNAPVNMTAVTVQEAVVVNLGRHDAWPLIRFRVDSGTATSVTLLNSTTGEQVTVTTSITAGQVLTFDAAAAADVSDGRIVDLSTAQRYSSWQPPYTGLRLAPGGNVLRATAVGTAGVTVTVTYQHTSLA